MEFYETQKWKKMIAEAQEHAIRTGGGGSNMAEPLYFKPGPVIPDDLPPEEIARRKKALEEMQKIVDRVAARVEAASD